MAGRKRSSYAAAALAAGGFAALLWLEPRDSLRRRQVQPKPRRVARNLAIAGATAAVVQVLERPIVEPLSRWVERREIGLLPRLRLPCRLEVGL